MKGVFTFFLCINACILSAWGHSHSIFPYIQNKGQWEYQVKYRADFSGGSMWIENSGITYAFFDHDKLKALHDGFQHYPNATQDGWIKAHALKVKFVGAQNNVAYQAQNQSSDYRNYFIGDPSKWQSNVHAFNEVKGTNVYPGIDVIYKEDHGKLKYEFVVSPGGSHQSIQIQYAGAQSMRIDDAGNAIIHAGIATMTEMKPFVYQIINGDTVEVKSKFILNNHSLSFDLGVYDSQVPLVIDPILLFSTYSGSTADNFGFTATYDSKGYLYSGGNVFGMGYPTTVGAYQVLYGGGNIDVAITKYDVSGTSLIYSTFLGGNGSEIPHSLVVNNYDELFVYGTTGSSNFPTSANCYDNTFNGGTSVTGSSMGFVYPQGCDIFVTRFNVAGTAIQASTFVGGTGNDGLNLAGGLKHNYADESRGEIDIDKLNYIYVASTTSSTNFPGVSNSFQSTYGGGTQDGCVFKMDNNLTTLIFATYIGGSGSDAVYSLTLGNSAGNMIIAGGTNSANFPTVGSTFQTPNGGIDGFISRISSNGATLINSILYGTPQYDQIYFVEADKQDNIYVLGQTDHMAGFYYNNALYGIPNGGQFISKFDPNLSIIDWSTSFGRGMGFPDISPSAFLVDVCNKIYISGWGGLVNSSLIPGSTVTGLDITPGAFQSNTTGSDFYLMVMEDNASALTYSTYFGGPTSAEHVDGGTSRFNRKGEIYQSVCAGCGSNSDFPIAPANAWSSTNNSFNCNVGVFKFKFDFPMTVADFDIPPAACAPLTMTMTNQSEGAISYLWSVSDGQTSTATNPTFNFPNGGIFDVTLYAINNSGATCNPIDSLTKQIVILGNSAQTIPNISTCDNNTSFEIGIPPSGVSGITYHWLPNTGLSDPTIPNPIYNTNSGSQTFQLVITNGICSDTLSQIISVSPLQNIQFNDTLVCAGQTIQLGSNNVPVLYNYSWSPIAGLSNPNSHNPSVTVTNSISYQLIYSYLNCADTTYRNITVLTPNAFNSPDTSICKGDSIQIHDIPFFPSGVNYHWNPTSQVSNPSIHNPVIWADTTTTFEVIIDNGVCADTAFKTIQIIQINNQLGPDIIKCKFDSISIGSSPINGYSYQWYPSNYLNNDTISNPIAYPSSTTSYMLQTSLDGTSCSAWDTILITVQPLAIPPFGFTEGITCSGLIYTPNLIGNNQYTYNWVLEPIGTSYQGPNPGITVPFKDTITISLTVSDGTCSEKISIEKEVGGFGNYFNNGLMPNIFTPNNDGVNECFEPKELEHGCYKLYVYNRWGNLYFDSVKTGDYCWNGRGMNKGELVSEGVYFWVLVIGIDEYHGTVTVYNK